MSLQGIMSEIRALPVEDRRTLIDLIAQTLPESPSVADLALSSPEAYLAAIHKAISEDAPGAAYQLAERGSQLYPGNQQLSQAMHVLAPPKVIAIENRTYPKQADSMRWLQNHGAEYIGQWVALRNGTLLGHAASRKVLIADFGIEDSPDTLITWLPDEL